MSQAVYAVYDVETGEVVHLHVEPDGLGSSPDEIVLMADVGRSRALQAVRLPLGEVPSGAARMVDGALAPHEGAGWGQAGVGGDAGDVGLERRYSPERRPAAAG